jgi:hypothetical protein
MQLLYPDTYLMTTLNWEVNFPTIKLRNIFESGSPERTKSWRQTGGNEKEA